MAGPIAFQDFWKGPSLFVRFLWVLPHMNMWNKSSRFVKLQVVWLLMKICYSCAYSVRARVVSYHLPWKKKNHLGACFQIQVVRTLLSPESGGYVLECRSVVLNHCNMSPKAAWSPINTLWHPPVCRQAQHALLILYCHAFILPTVSKVSMEIHSYISKIAHNGPLTMTFFKQQTALHCQSPSSVPESQIPNIKPRILTMGSICVQFDHQFVYFPLGCIFSL